MEYIKIDSFASDSKKPSASDENHSKIIVYKSIRNFYI
jgi:hypothetical protein